MTPPDDLPRIEITERIADVEDRAIAALAEHCDEVFQRHPLGLVRIVRSARGESPVVKEPEPALLRSWLDRSASCVARNKKGAWKKVAPPPWLAMGVLARREYPGTIRPLVGVVEAPLLREDGTVLTRPGYDPATCVYFHGQAVEVAEAPSREEAQAAFRRLADLFADFAFQGRREVAEAACVAAILTPLARAAIRGPCPAWMFAADRPGAGKTLLASVVGALVCGRSPAVNGYTSRDEEMAKLLGAIALQAPPVALFDNIREHLEGSALERAITAPDAIAQRILGQSSAPELRWRTVLLCTGNGVSYNLDTGEGRFLHVELRAQERADGFTHADLLAHVLDKRTDYLRDALTILRAHVVAERPQVAATLARFPAWSRCVADAVTWASGTDPIAARPPDDALQEAGVHRAVVHAWARVLSYLPGSPITVADLKRWLEGLPERGESEGVVAALALRSALADLCGAASLNRESAHSIGKRLGRLQGKAYPVEGGGTIALAGAVNRNGVKAWTVTFRGSLAG